VGGGDLVENRVDEGCFTGAGTSGDQDILFRVDRLYNGCLLVFCHDPLGYVVIDGENQQCLLPDRKCLSSVIMSFLSVP